MPDSADNTSAHEETLDEDSDVIELTDEVSDKSSASADDLDELGISMPEFRVPSDGAHAATVDDGRDDDTEAIPAEELEEIRAADAPADPDADPSARAGAEGFDREELVKTVRMEAFDRDQIEKLDAVRSWEVAGMLDDQRYAPDILIDPPRVLTRKWQDGARNKPNGATGASKTPEARRSMATTIKTAPLPADVGQELEAFQDVEPQPEDDERQAEPIELDDDVVELEEDSLEFEDDSVELDEDSLELEEDSIELDDESFELEESEPLSLDSELIEESDPGEVAAEGEAPKPPPKPTTPPQKPGAGSTEGQGPQHGPKQPPAQPSVKQEPGRQHRTTGPLPPQQPRPKPPQSAEDDLSGIVQELLDEKKARPQPKKEQKKPEDDRRANWFHDVFGEEYLRTLPKDLHRQTERDVRFILESLGLQKGARILDLACGFGRHSVALARRDYEVAGLDLSMAMLQRALNEAQRRSLSIKFIHGDMRELNFNEIFDGCFCWQTSFGYFDDRTNLSVVRGVNRALKPGGRFLLDVVNRDYVIAEMPSRTWWEGVECVFLEEVEFDHGSSVLHTKRSFIYEDGSPPQEFSSFVRLYSLHELQQLLRYGGFRMVEVSGEIHHRGAFLGPSSSRLIVLAEKVTPQ